MTWNAKSHVEGHVSSGALSSSPFKKLKIAPQSVSFGLLCHEGLLSQSDLASQKGTSLRADFAKHSFKGSEMRVLVVDDNSVNRQVVLHMLQQFGCNVDTVENGAAAIAATREAHYELVFMDCLMPVMDGWKAAQAIRKIPGPSQKTRIVAMTACALQEDKRRCHESGMDAFLQKPLTLNAVAEELQHWQAYQAKK